MSRALDTLARLQRSQIDAVKAALAEMVAARAALAARDAALVAEHAAEQGVAARDLQGMAAYGAYAPRVAGMRRALAQEDAALGEQEAALRAQLADAYIELKKVEQLLATQAERERLAMNARELAAMDEAAAMRAARRQR
jgi:flagellar export protein FliJ